MESGRGTEYRRRPGESIQHRRRPSEGGERRRRPSEGTEYRQRQPEGTEYRRRQPEGTEHRRRQPDGTEYRRRQPDGTEYRRRPSEDTGYRRETSENRKPRRRAPEDVLYTQRSEKSTEHRSGSGGYKPRYRGNIRRVRQRNLRVGIFLLVLLVGIAGAVNAIKAKQQEAAAQAYAEQQAKKEIQEAEEKEEDNGLKLADESEKDQWYLKLVNAKNPMTQEDVPEVATETIDANGYQVDARIMGDLEDMFADAQAAGRNPVICSAFRSWDTQEYLYQNKIQRVMAEEGLSQEEAAVEAGTVVAVPGTSEHQIGLAVDIVSSEYMNLDEKQMETEDQQWLMENSWRYGFILRYPLNKSDITGIIFEPWHYRYVGKEAAKEIYEQDITLEEYLGAEPVGSSQAIESDSEEETLE